MTYVGQQPTTGDFIKLDSITTSSATTFNLRQGSVAVYPQSANHCIVSLNGVIQAPVDAFTIVNDTIVFASSLASSDVINFILVLGNVNDIGVPSSSTVGVSQLSASGSASSSTYLRGDNAWASAGITEVDNWRISAAQSISADTGTVVNSSWERNDFGSDKIGTGLTESSGVFTFPSTGIYLISYQQHIARAGDSRYFTGSIMLSTNSGAAYSIASRGYTSIKQTTSSTSAGLNTSCTIDVTNASTFRLRFETDGDEAYDLRAESAYQITGFYCIKLGDT